jgi:DNA processing protein
VKSAYLPPCEHDVQILSFNRLIGGRRRDAPVDSQLRLFAEEQRSERLWCAGDLSLAGHASVAVVGTRDPTTGGVTRARRLARELARAGVVVVSGLARGVDTEALVAAIKNGGRVIGVIGTPLNQAYPAENRRLHERIYREHLLVSQFAPGQRVHQSNFPARNRLMAALCDATAIIEAGDNSGTLYQAAECVRLERWLFIARSVADNPRLKWPAKFLGKPRVRVLRSTTDILEILGESVR